MTIEKLFGKEVPSKPRSIKFKQIKAVFVSFFTSIHPPVFHTHSSRHGVLNWFVNVS